MKLFALSDLHVGFPANRAALETLGSHPEDWLILAGDLGETLGQVDAVLATATARFAKVLFVPGNHELWTTTEGEVDLGGEAKYQALVAVCRRRGVLTPEDPFAIWEGEGGPHVLAPMFLLYDYTFRPDSVSRSEAIQWAADAGPICADERMLSPDPYVTRDEWCAARCYLAEKRLAEIPAELPTVLINHFPLRYGLARLPLLPRFTLWCGTRRTEDWHRKYRARVVVSGHLHIPSTRHVDGVRFEEVSVGYPRQWKPERGLESKLREILPGA
jgi:predicted phosphodiesterase